jgi:hypothetical protein
MVERQIEARGIRNRAVLRAMRTVPRHRFVPDDMKPYAYQDRPLPIGYGQTISQPYIVALMSELANVRPGARVLEVGTGSGYQAAVLAEMGAEVYSIEIVEALAKRARVTLFALGRRLRGLAREGPVRCHCRHGRACANPAAAEGAACRRRYPGDPGGRRAPKSRSVSAYESRVRDRARRACPFRSNDRKSRVETLNCEAAHKRDGS